MSLSGVSKLRRAGGTLGCDRGNRRREHRTMVRRNDPYGRWHEGRDKLKTAGTACIRVGCLLRGGRMMTSMVPAGSTVFAGLRSSVSGSDGGPCTVDLLDRQQDCQRKRQQGERPLEWPHRVIRQ